MQPTSTSFVDRIVGAIRLDSATYDEVENDSNATWQAVAVVAGVAVLTGIGAATQGTDGLIGGVISSLIFWAIYTFFVYIVGTMLLRSPETSASFSQVLRPLGFAYAPSFLGILGFIPLIGWLMVLIGGIWSVAASIVAIRQSLEVTTGRAVAVAIIAFVAMVAVMVLLALVLGFGAYSFGGMAGVST